MHNFLLQLQAEQVTPIVTELYLFDTILNGSQPNIKRYELSDSPTAPYSSKEEEAEAAEEKEQAEGGEITSESRLRELNPAEVNSKFRKALAKPASNVMRAYKVQFSGKFSGSQKQMQDLVTAHGGKIGTKAVFSLLIATPHEYDCESAKVLQAEIKDVPILHEIFLYDAIINGKVPDIGDYDLSKY